MIQVGDTVRVGSSSILYDVASIQTDAVGRLAVLKASGGTWRPAHQRERHVYLGSRTNLKLVRRQAPTEEQFRACIARNPTSGCWINGTLHHWGCECGCASSTGR